MKEFKNADIIQSVGHCRISTLSFREELQYSPPAWMKRGLQESRTGYGARLNSGYKISFEGRLYRVYTTIFSNAGSSWFKVKGVKIFVD